MYKKILSLDIKRIITDTDLDGVVTGAILNRYWKDAEIIFTQAGLLRSGELDEKIDIYTAICDLPYRAKCGLNIDHHQSNKPSLNLDIEGIIAWEDSPSASRIAYNIVSTELDLSDLDELLVWVDKFDSGNISKEEYLSENNILWLGRIIADDSKIALHILKLLKDGLSVNTILKDDVIVPILSKKKEEQSKIIEIIRDKMEIINRLAIVNFEGHGIRSNGYSVTAIAGNECDACIVIHGKLGASFEDYPNYPASASFYTNSFLHKNKGVYDLTKLARRFDEEGGGHPNACGCRIKIIGNNQSNKGEVQKKDLDDNLNEWIRMWNKNI
tara:strand:+ start:1114 stop:2097 length:984 start_codon:yes stop_codon:yes gene_type:complete